MKGTVDIHMDLGSFGADLDYPFEHSLRDEVSAIVREEIRKALAKQTRKALKKWVEEEFLGEAKLQVRDGMVTIPLLLDLKELQHG